MIRKFAAFFAGGGANMNWFDLLYPDGDGKALGTSGDAFNMFDSRYSAYAARIDAVSCYNLINGILDKKVAAERTWSRRDLRVPVPECRGRLLHHPLPRQRTRRHHAAAGGCEGGGPDRHRWPADHADRVVEGHRT
jgi:hypothetical protein